MPIAILSDHLERHCGAEANETSMNGKAYCGHHTACYGTEGKSCGEERPIIGTIATLRNWI